GVIDGEDVFEGDPGGLPFLLLVITVRRFGRAAALPCSFGQAPSASAPGQASPGAYAAVIAAVAAHTADRLGSHSSRGRTGRECSTALGAVAVCTSSTGLPCPYRR